MRAITRYACGVCGKEHDSITEATACEKQKQPKAMAAVGDIVTVGAGYTWFDGDKRWISNPDVKPQAKHRSRNCFSSCCTMAFFYVVTAIDIEPGNSHRRRYHIATNAMSGKQGHTGGYTFDTGHVSLKRVKVPPPFVLADSKKLIGKKAKGLL